MQDLPWHREMPTMQRYGEEIEGLGNSFSWKTEGGQFAADYPNELDKNNEPHSGTGSKTILKTFLQIAAR